MNWKQRLIGIPNRAIHFASLGFTGAQPETQEFLEAIIASFADGYHAAMAIADEGRLVERLSRDHGPHRIGFAYEGAGMYYALLDLILPGGPSRLRAFTEGPGRKYAYIVTVGAGFAIGRLPWGAFVLERYMRRLHPLMAWCVPDGYGFHQGIFHHRRYIEACAEPPRPVPSYAESLFDSGIGRSMWWVLASSPQRIKQAIDRFPERRRAELWCGIGVACAYAGGIDVQGLRELHACSGRYSADFLSGPPFAAQMRVEGENPSHWTELACETLYGKSPEATADMAMQALAAARPDAMSETEIRERLYTQIRGQLRDKVEAERTIAPTREGRRGTC